MNNNNLISIIKVLRETDKNIVISGHKNADYDSLCSSIALALILEKLKKRVHVYIEPEKINNIKYFNCDRFLCSKVDFDNFLFIAVDLNKFSRLPDYLLTKVSKADLILNIDHHNGNETNSDVVVSKSQKSSTCEIIYDMLVEMKLKFSKDIAELLFVGIISDTNLFSSYATSKIFTIVSNLIRKGIDAKFLINKFYIEKTEKELKIISYIIDNIVYDEFHYAVIDMKDEKFKNVNYSDISKNCIPTVLCNKEIELFMLIFDYGEKIKGEIRSKNDLDVSKLGTLLTGGGHFHAAGFSNKKSIDKIIKITKRYLAEI